MAAIALDEFCGLLNAVRVLQASDDSAMGQRTRVDVKAEMLKRERSEEYSTAQWRDILDDLLISPHGKSPP